MKTPTPSSRSRADILADILALPPAIAGTLSHYSQTLKNGQTVIHHHIQRSINGRNKTVYVPAHKLDAVKAGIAAHARFKALADELAMTDLDAVMADPTDDAAKKKRTKSSSASPARPKRSSQPPSSPSGKTA